MAMRISRLYVEQKLAVGVPVELDQHSARYMRAVLRLTEGDPVVVFDGRGGEYRALLESSGKTSARIVAKEFDPVERESPLHIHLAIGISRGERMDLVVQKATELGVTEITPLLTQRCEVRLNQARAIKKNQHWRQIAINACQQSQRNRLPDMRPVATIGEWLWSSQQGLKLLLDQHGEGGVARRAPIDNRVVLLVGPEGGFEASEVAAAESAGFIPLGLGPRVLRTETAPIAALGILQALWGDLQ
jgi:16S rRNA (uracil1498-N3)-methyltransferase